VVEHLLCKCEALRSNPSLTKRRRRRKKKKEEGGGSRGENVI
jgi:hypothetical protein